MNCQCGCGEPITVLPWHKYVGKPIRFRPGHHMRTVSQKRARASAQTKTPPKSWKPPTGLCECGCGERTPIARQTRIDRGQYRGFPLRFVHGHNDSTGNRDYRGDKHPNWKGGRKRHAGGYWEVWTPDRGHVLEHRLVWEQTHGRRLGDNEHVHHIDGNPENNAPENLVALTRNEHLRIHREERAKNPRARAKLSRAVTEWWAKRKNR